MEIELLPLSPLPAYECGPHTGHAAIHTPEQIAAYATAYAEANVAKLREQIAALSSQVDALSKEPCCCDALALEVEALRSAGRKLFRALDLARDTIQPITTAQIKMHGLNPMADKIIDAALVQTAEIFGFTLIAAGRVN